MKSTIGIISANYTNEKFGPLAMNRTLASIPFAGRYRLVDFPLSSMVNSGLTTVGMIMPYNYRSLIDHIGVGKAWSLGRKAGGMFILPGSVYGIRTPNVKFLLQDLIRNRYFFERDTADYVLFCSSNRVYNFDFRDLIEFHEKSGNPMTMVYQKVTDAEIRVGPFMDISEEGKVLRIYEEATGEANRFIDCCIFNRTFLLNFLDWFSALSHIDVFDIAADNADKIGIGTYEFQGYVGSVDDLDDYIRVSLDLLKPQVRAELFDPLRYIRTKVADVPPSIYRPDAKVKNSLISAGCIIEGEVENSIIFRSANIAKGAVVKNCIIMQHGDIGENAYLDRVVCDKYVKVEPGVRIEGGKGQPFIIGKYQKA